MILANVIDRNKYYYERDCAMYHGCVLYRSRDWSGDFTTSFQDLLPGGVFHVPSDEGTTIKV